VSQFLLRNIYNDARTQFLCQEIFRYAQLQGLLSQSPLKRSQQQEQPTTKFRFRSTAMFFYIL
jgi:hypothetical protein